MTYEKFKSLALESLEKFDSGGWTNRRGDFITFDSFKEGDIEMVYFKISSCTTRLKISLERSYKAYEYLKGREVGRGELEMFGITQTNLLAWILLISCMGLGKGFDPRESFKLKVLSRRTKAK